MEKDGYSKPRRMMSGLGRQLAADLRKNPIRWESKRGNRDTRKTTLKQRQIGNHSWYLDDPHTPSSARRLLPSAFGFAARRDSPVSFELPPSQSRVIRPKSAPQLPSRARAHLSSQIYGKYVCLYVNRMDLSGAIGTPPPLGVKFAMAREGREAMDDPTKLGANSMYAS